MNFSELVGEKRKIIGSMRDPEGIDAVFKHLNAAIKHFAHAREKDDDGLYSDVIFRTNLVFEGILKEAFEVLAKKSPIKKKLIEIEESFIKNKVFSPRVLDYFTRYRQGWRNPATHDYQINFDEQEAFLAISTVSAFCYVALDQMITQLAVQVVSDTTELKSGFPQPSNIANIAFAVSEAIPDILRERLMDHEHLHISESLFEGYIEGLLSLLVPAFEITRGKAINEANHRHIVDLSLRLGQESIIFDIKGLQSNRISAFRRSKIYKDQLASYAKLTQATKVIGIVYPKQITRETIPHFEVVPVNNALVHTQVILPKV